MDQYESYYSFFADILKIIKDIKLDFDESGISGADFDARYKTFLHRLIQRCKKFNDMSFCGKSDIVSSYISSVSDTVNLAQNIRFDMLMKTTDKFMRRCMG